MEERYHWRTLVAKFLVARLVSPYAYSIYDDKLMWYSEAADSYRRESLDLRAELDIVVFGMESEDDWPRREYGY